MEYTILQTPGDPPSVLDALASVGSGGSDRAGVEHSHGWTSVRLEGDAAARFAPPLVQLRGHPVLVWAVDAERCRVTFYRPNSGPLDAEDRPEDVDRLVKAFNESIVTLSPETENDQPKALDAAAGTPQDRHRAIAQRLGVPYTVPDQPAKPSAATPSLTEASVPLGAQDFRRRERVRNARSWLHFASGFGLVAIVLLVIRGPWIGIPIAVGVIGILQLIRYALGRSLPPST